MKTLYITCAAALLASPFALRAAPAQRLSNAFESHLADRTPCPDASARWRLHYAPVTRQLSRSDHRVKFLFNSVVDSMVSAKLPTEYALIPFVESHYKPEVKSRAGPSGLWQFTADTARARGLKVSGRQDERMNATLATAAAIRYLKYLHRMFKGNTEHVLMAFNAGEGRLQASRRKGGRKLSAITHVYPDKIQAISCNVLQQKPR